MSLPANQNNDPEFYLNSARLAAQDQKFDLALNNYQQTIILDPKNAPALFELGSLLCSFGQMDLGVNLIINAAKIEPQLGSPEIHHKLAIENHLAGNPQAALTHYTWAVKLSGNSKDRISYLIEYYCSLGRIDQALDYLKNLINDFPELAKTDNKSHINQSVPYKIYYLEKNLAELKSSFELWDKRLEESKWQEQIDLNRFQEDFFKQHALAGNLSDAITLSAEKLKLDPQNLSLLYKTSQIYKLLAQIAGKQEYAAQSTDNLNSIISTLQQIFLVNQSNSAKMLALVYYSLAQALQIQDGKNYVIAQKCYDLSTQLDPEFSQAWIEQASILQQQGVHFESENYISNFVKTSENRAQKHPIGRSGVRILGEVNTYAIGHLGNLPAVYIMAQELGWLPKYKTILIAPKGMVCNYAFLEYFKKYFEVVTDPIEIKKLQELRADLEFDTSYLMLPNKQATNMRIASGSVHAEWDRQGRQALFTLSKRDQERGEKALNELGLPNGAWFVGMHVREGGFKQEGESNYNRHRNSNLEDFYPAIKAITDRGGWVVRMGESNMKRMPQMPNAIDYAHSNLKSDWMDVYICAESKFFLATAAGIQHCPPCFGVPTVAVNQPPTHYRFNSKNIFLPKLLRDKSTQELLSLKKLFVSPIYECENGNFLHELNFEFVDNSAIEIKEAVDEMLDRLLNNTSYDQESENLQQSFRNLNPQPEFEFPIRIGDKFLKRYKHLL